MDVTLEAGPSCSTSVPARYLNTQDENVAHADLKEAQLSLQQIPINYIRQELYRVSELLEAETSPANAAMLTKFYKMLKPIRTPAQVYAFALEKLKCHRKR